MPDGCCSWQEGECSLTSSYCNDSKGNCEDLCGGKWLELSPERSSRSGGRK